jgi:hypothetical protein
MHIREITEAILKPDAELIQRIMPVIQDSVEEYLEELDGEHDWNSLEEILNSNIEDDFDVEFIMDYNSRKDPKEIVSAGASWDEKQGTFISVYLHAQNLDTEFDRLTDEIEKKIAHETVHAAQYKRMGAATLNKHRSGHQKGTELKQRTGRDRDWLRSYLRDPHELQARAADLAREISQTENPEQTLRNPEQYQSQLSTYRLIRSIFPSNTPQIRQLLKYTAQYLKQQ